MMTILVFGHSTAGEAHRGSPTKCRVECLCHIHYGFAGAKIIHFCRSRKSRTLIYGFGDRYAAIAPYSRGVRGGARTLDLLIHIQALLPTELQSPCLRSLAELNHVLWIFSPSHTPRLPKLQCVGKTGFEPAASSSQGWPSSTELLPDGRGIIPT